MSNLTTLFTDIANAIREKKGTTEKITASDFPQEILTIAGSGNVELTTTAGIIEIPTKDIKILSNDGIFGKPNQDEAQYDLQLFGESIQNGTPTPDIPVPFSYINKNITIECKRENDILTLSFTLLHDMYSLPNGTRDIVYRDNTTGKWYDEQRIKKETYNGGEGWSKVSTLSADAGRYMFRRENIAFAKSDEVMIMSNYYKGIPFNNRTDKSVPYIYYENGYIGVYHPNMTVLGNFTPWLASHNLDVIFELQTPIVTEITDETTIEALENIRTYTGLTEITSSIPLTGSYSKLIIE